MARLALFSLLCAAVSAQDVDDKPEAMKRRQGGFFGLALSEVVEAGARRLEITAVRETSDAHRLGFRAGDVIVGVDGKKAADGDHFIKLLYGTRSTDDQAPRREHHFDVRRAGKALAIAGSVHDLDRQPALGEMAPDFTLARADGSDPVTLSELWDDKPVFLVFGSYT